MRHLGYDDLLELLRARRSVRRFLDRPVARADLARLIEAARWAPSNHNRQPWKFVAIEDREVIRGLAKRVGQILASKLTSLPPVASAYAGELVEHATGFGDAPLLILALHKHPIRLSAALLEGVGSPALVSGEPLSVAMAVQNLLLAAQALNLGACVLTAPLIARDTVAATVELPAGFDLTCLIAVGHPAEIPAAPRRKSLEQIAEFRDDPPAEIHEDR